MFVGVRRQKCEPELCQNCVTYPRNRGATPSSTGTPRGTTLLREVVDRNCVGRIRCASARVSGINFQACSLTTRTPLRYLLRGSSSSGASVAARDTRDTHD